MSVLNKRGRHGHRIAYWFGIAKLGNGEQRWVERRAQPAQSNGPFNRPLIGGDAAVSDSPRYAYAFANEAQTLLKLRRIRRDHLPGNLFAEPAWDILLSLYCSEAFGQSETLASLASAVSAAESTAGRWLDCLEQEGLIERSPGLFKTMHVMLTPAGRQALEQYFKSASDLLF